MYRNFRYSEIITISLLIKEFLLSIKNLIEFILLNYFIIPINILIKNMVHDIENYVIN